MLLELRKHRGPITHLISSTQAHWKKPASCKFRDTLKSKCPVSAVKSVFSFTWNRWTWIWQCTWVVAHNTAVWKLNVRFAIVNNVASTLNPTLNIELSKANMRLKKAFFWSNHYILPWFHKLFYHDCTRWAPEQVYYARKPMELVIWCKRQKILVYKSCTTVEIFWSQNMVLCK